MWENFFLVVIEFVINVQLKYLTHIFCLSILSHKLYEKNVFAHIKIHVLIWDNLKKV
jgi:hypothetical protein